MNIFTFLAAYALSDDLLRCYDAANADNMTWLLFLHSQRPDVIAACETLARYPNVVYFPYGDNRGMSKSINEAVICALAKRADVFMSLNDDVICPAARAQELAESAFASPNSAYVCARGFTQRISSREALGFSCCAWNMRAFENVGYFDEYFHPFYFMDADWKRRAKLLDLKTITVDMPDVIHAGSKTLTHVDGEANWLVNAFDNTLAYYLTKWGGDQKQEAFAMPFNDPSIGLKIEAIHRHDPYTAHRPAFLAKAL